MTARARLAATVMCALVLLTACGIPDDSEPRAIPPNEVLFDLLTPSTSEAPTTAPVATAQATVFLIGPQRLVAVTRTVAAPASLGTVLASVIQGATDSEASSGLRSAVDSQTRVLNAQVTNGIARINVNEAFSGIGLPEQILALAQIVYTATALPGVNAVEVSLNSTLIEVPRGDGSLTREPLRRSDFSQLAPVG